MTIACCCCYFWLPTHHVKRSRRPRLRRYSAPACGRRRERMARKRAPLLLTGGHLDCPTPAWVTTTSPQCCDSVYTRRPPRIGVLRPSSESYEKPRRGGGRTGHAEGTEDGSTSTRRGGCAQYAGVHCALRASAGTAQCSAGGGGNAHQAQKGESPIAKRPGRAGPDWPLPHACLTHPPPPVPIRPGTSYRLKTPPTCEASSLFPREPEIWEQRKGKKKQRQRDNHSKRWAAASGARVPAATQSKILCRGQDIVTLCEGAEGRRGGEAEGQRVKGVLAAPPFPSAGPQQ